jgi:hypothetical protein
MLGMHDCASHKLPTRCLQILSPTVCTCQPARFIQGQCFRVWNRGALFTCARARMLRGEPRNACGLHVESPNRKKAFMKRGRISPRRETSIFNCNCAVPEALLATT